MRFSSYFQLLSFSVLLCEVAHIIFHRQLLAHSLLCDHFSDRSVGAQINTQRGRAALPPRWILETSQEEMKQLQLGKRTESSNSLNKK